MDINSTLETTIDRLRADWSHLVNENERLAAENAALSWERAWEQHELLEVARHAAQAAGPLDRLLSTFDRIARSGSIIEVLVAAAIGLTDNFARVAVFAAGEAREQALETKYQRGFDSIADFETIRIRLNDESTKLGSWTAAVTIPVIVRGEMLAVIYADRATSPSEDERGGHGVTMAKILGHHVTLALERLTADAQSALRAERVSR